MKTFLSSLFIGLILLYFLDISLRVGSLNLEMFIHNLVRFFTGFVFLGIWVWKKHKLKFKIAMYIILVFLISDDIFDYVRGINNLRLEILIHDFYVVVWGAVSGYFFSKYLHWKNK